MKQPGWIRKGAWAALAIGGVAAVLATVPFDENVAQRLVAATLAREAMSALRGCRGFESACRDPLPSPPLADTPRSEQPRVALQISGPPALVAEVRRTISAARGFVVVPEGGSAPLRLVLELRPQQRQLQLAGRWVSRDGSVVRWEGRRRWATAWSALPPLVAIILALVTRRVVVSIGAGVVVGALMFVWLSPEAPAQGWSIGYHVQSLPAALWRAGADYLFGAATSEFTLYVLGFTFALCGMVGIAGRAGGNIGIVQAIAGVASDARRTRLATGLMGLAIFFEDYANAIVVGQTARPLTDAKRISREKLAYLVDSTAAPVAGLALVSTWIGWEVGLFQAVSDELGLASRGYQMFVQAVAYRFYCMFALFFLFASTLMRRDFGPMLRAERRAFHNGELTRPGARPLSSGVEDKLDPVAGVTPRWWVTGLPVITLLLAVVVGMVIDGGRTLSAEVDFSWSWTYLRDAFAHGDNGPVLLVAAMIGSCLAVVLARGQRASPPEGGPSRPLLSYGLIGRAWVIGGWASAPALAILVTAKALQNSCGDLSTSAYLVALLGEGVPPWLLPVAIFLAAAVVAFATGTSWGTMGILIPAVGPLAYHVGGESLMLLVLASVLDGAIFGDHCSPISDTTIMSSLSSRCDHVDHVRTQAPYAIAAMIVAATVGYLGISLGLSSPVSLLLGAALIIAMLMLVGRDPEAA